MNVIKKHDESFGLCLKKSDWTVDYQNEYCQNVCGDIQGQICHRSCWRLAKENALIAHTNVGIQSHHNKMIESQICDLALVFSADKITSILCLLGLSDKEEKEFFIKKGFTNREIEILQLREKGFKNIEIEYQLNITHSTLKTHIGHILRKIRRKN
jgi:ATP/maltotriose-dependent transcriptional regulator MalT